MVNSLSIAMVLNAVVEGPESSRLTVVSNGGFSRELRFESSEVDFELDFHRCLERSGLQTPCPQDIMSSVEMFLDHDLLNLFVTDTNLYYSQQNNGNVNESTKNKGWILNC